MQLKWAIIGTGNICSDFAIALSTCDPAEHQIVAVGSRDEKKKHKILRPSLRFQSHMEHTMEPS